MILKTHRHLLGGTLLIAGTSIGVGMFAVPVVTAFGGFLPAFVVYLICWIFMVAIARLILEACLWMPKDSNLITINRNLLGKFGELACWILYLFLFYCLLTAHVAAGGAIVGELISAPSWASALIYTAVFAPVVYLGTLAVDRVNIVLMIGVVITYLLFITTAAAHIDLDFLSRINWSKIWPALPAILTAFGFQNLIPTLLTYMERDHKKLRKAIWVGTAIPFALYVVWEFVVLAIVPLESLEAAQQTGQSAIVPLQLALSNTRVSSIAAIFSFFALTTSFVGISIAFFDFWADGLHWAKKGAKRTALLALVFVIPLAFVFFDPRIFLKALDLAGGLGMILLLGVLPILFVWSGRYIHKHTENRFVPGGKPVLVLMLAFCVLVLLIQIV